MTITSIQSSNATSYPPESETSIPLYIERNAKIAKIAKLSFCGLGITIGGVISAVGILTGLSVVAHLYFNTTIGLTIYRVVRPIFFTLGYVSGFFAIAFKLSPSLGESTKEVLPLIAVASFVVPFLPLTIGTVGAAPGLIIMKHSYDKGISIYNDHVD